MDVEKFEQDILELAFETDVRITTASVAYYLGVPSTKAEPMLDELLERGVLELDSDEKGNLYYRVVDAAASDSGKLSQLKHERLTGIDGGVDPVDAPEPSVAGDRPGEPHVIGDATVDGTGEETGAYSPRHGGDPDAGRRAASSGDREGTTGSIGEGRIVRGGESGSGRTGERSGSKDSHLDAVVRRDPSDGPERNDDRGGPAAGTASKTDGALAGVTRKQTATDARVDSCGEDPLVVQSEAQCEPRPFTDSSPVVASCAEKTSRSSTGLMRRSETRSKLGRVTDRGGGSARAASRNSMMYRDQDQFEQPEHQPGMSLLLSLILCGTGQIYNGEVSKGIMMMVLCFLLWFVLLGWVVHIWSIVDSVVVAERINRQSGDTPNTTGPGRQLSSG